MSGWIVYSKDGATEKCRLKKLEYSGSFMNERSVTSTFEHSSEVQFEVFDFITYRGEVFEIESIPTVKKTSSMNYSYELRFVSHKYELERCEMRDIVPYENGIVYPTPLSFSFTGDVRYLAERIQACLDSMYGDGVWSIIIADGVTSDEHNITLSQQNCWNALALVNTTYGLNFYIKGRVITIGGEQPIVEHVFKYGKGNGLYEIERTSNTETGIVTKLRAYGSTRNLDYSYPKRPDWSDSILDTSFVLSPLRLMLPSFKLDGKTDYVMASDELIAKYGVREASVVYEDIYPSITDAKNSAGEAIDEIKSVETVDDTLSTFVVSLPDLGFDLQEHLTNDVAQISMKSGSLQGYTFNIQEAEKQSDNSYLVTLERITLSEGDTDNFNVPNSKWNMSAGDKFVLLNILMPQEYIRDAEDRLLVRANEYLEQYAKTNFGYNIGIHDKFLIQNPSVYDELIEGSKLSIYDEEIGISESVTIQSVTITENADENTLPQVKVVLNNEPTASTLDRIQGQINDLASGTSGSYSKQAGILNQYRRKLDRPYFDKLFVAIDKDGNEIPSNDMTTEVYYIRAKYHFSTVGGVTMYEDDGFNDLPSLYDGLPIDNQTLVWKDSVLMVNPDIDLGGGLDETQLAEYLTNNNYAKKDDITSALSGYATATQLADVNTRIDNFLEGSDTDGIINKWKELETFLSGLSESDDLATILSTKWTTDNNLINQWNTAYGWGDHSKVGYALKSYVDSNFVTTDETEQTILGKKNFTGGLLVNGSPIVYDATNKYWKLEGDLLVTGGVTMYADEGTYTPSTIMDAIAVDDVTISKANGYLEVIGGGSGSSVEYPLSWSGFSNGSYDGSNAQSFYIPTKLSEFLNDSGYITSSAIPTKLSQLTDDMVSGKYLPLTGGTMVSGAGIYNSNDSLQGAIGFNENENCFGSIAFPTVLRSSVAILARIKDVDYNILHSGNYSSYALPLSGGTLTGSLLTKAVAPSADNTYSFGYSNYRWATGHFARISLSSTSVPLTVNREEGTVSSIQYSNAGTITGILGFDTNGVLLVRPDYQNNSAYYSVWHSGNDGADSGLDADLLDGVHMGNLTRYIFRYNTTYLIPSGTDLDVYNYSDGTLGYYTTGDNKSYINSPIKNFGLLCVSLNTYYTGQLMFGYGDNSFLYYRSQYYLDGNIVWHNWRRLAFIGDNVASATKLQTARTIWGQSFDGTGNVNGQLTINKSTTSAGDYEACLLINGTYAETGFHRALSYENKNMAVDSESIIYIGAKNSQYNGGYLGFRYKGAGSQSNFMAIGLYSADNALCVLGNGNVGIGTTSPNSALHVNGQGRFAEGLLLHRGSDNTPAFFLGKNGTTADFYIYNSSGSGRILFGTNTNNAITVRLVVYGSGISVTGNILASGGITMYSDIRKKTKLRDVELSLSQIANAPLIEHYYNTDEKKTTHVGSIAQYWAGLNDWFCKKDDDGYYTMEIQNAALASAISVARELVKYESKTDKKIRMLKKRISQLEDEIESLKKGA